MSDNYICKDCNYMSDVAGNCPICDMPLDPIDSSKINEETGEVETYDTKDIEEAEKNIKNDPDIVAE